MTTREVRVDGRPHCAKGDTLALYWKMRTPAKDKPIHLIGSAYVKSCKKYGSLYDFLLTRQSHASLIYYLRNEGFEDMKEFLEWWVGCPRLGSRVADSLLQQEVTVLRSTGPVEVIQWQYPLISAEKAIK